MAGSFRRVVGIIAVVLGVSLFGFGYWIAFESAYLIGGSVRSAFPTRVDLFRIVYLLLGGFALYAVGSYLVRSLRLRSTATPTSETIVVRMRCQTCRQLNDEDAKYCKQCGQVI